MSLGKGSGRLVEALKAAGEGAGACLRCGSFALGSAGHWRMCNVCGYSWGYMANLTEYGLTLVENKFKDGRMQYVRVPDGCLLVASSEDLTVSASGMLPWEHIRQTYPT